MFFKVKVMTVSVRDLAQNPDGLFDYFRSDSVARKDNYFQSHINL